MSQKIPLFGGVIASVPVPSGLLPPFFTPPDKDSDVPGTYEVHLYVMQSEDEAVVVSAFEGTQTAAAVPVWIGESTVDGAPPIVKALDGYVVRGDVSLMLAAQNKGGEDPVSVWGYYYRTGQGAQIQAERRAIGQELEPFNAGVPFRLAEGESAIIHEFEADRIDEISLAFLHVIGDLDASFATLTFEDVNNNVLASAKFRPRVASSYFAAGAVQLPPFGSLFPPSPYQIYQCPFGGGVGFPTLHHLRVTNDSDPAAPELVCHGYFTRR